MRLYSTRTSTCGSRWLPLALVLLPSVGTLPATEVNTASDSVLTFVEVRVEMRGHASSVFRQQANTARQHQASPGQIVVMQEIARPERFVVLEREAPAVLMEPRTLLLAKVGRGPEPLKSARRTLRRPLAP
jgi:hypothetical protein